MPPVSRPSDRPRGAAGNKFIAGDALVIVRSHGAATGGAQADAVASGRIATSPEDVRRQSENRPTAAQAAAQGGDAKASPERSSEDKVSQAKMALQRAVDLNARGDQGCREAVKQAQELTPQHGR